MQTILKLDLAGQPRGWLTVSQAVTAYARGDVVYGIGDPLPPIFGGIQRLSGLRSRIEMVDWLGEEEKAHALELLDGVSQPE